MHNDVEKILFTEEEIHEAVKRLGREIERDYKDKNPLCVCVLKGSLIFTADLMRCINMELEVDFMKASSYGDGTVSGELKIKTNITADTQNRDIIILEDIVDTGNTLYALKKYFMDKGAKSVKICALTSKPSRRTVDIEADYLGFEVPDEFIVGYGLDYAEKYRNLPYIGILKRSVYA